MWGLVFISEMRLWYSWYDDNGHGVDYVLSDIIISIDFLFLSLVIIFMIKVNTINKNKYFGLISWILRPMTH